MNKELVKDPIAAWESFHSELVIGLVGAVGTENAPGRSGFFNLNWN